MSREKRWVDSNHYRVVSDDGSKSWLYEVSGLFGSSHCVEVAHHHDDGTTTAYEAGGVMDSIFHSDGRGRPK